jgi:splicing factor 3B subunit 2
MYILSLHYSIHLAMPAATATLPNGNGTVVNGHADAKKSSAKSRGALKRLKAKAKAARAGTESEAETDKESDAEVCSNPITFAGLDLTQSSRSLPLRLWLRLSI